LLSATATAMTREVKWLKEGQYCLQGLGLASCLLRMFWVFQLRWSRKYTVHDLWALIALGTKAEYSRQLILLGWWGLMRTAKE
jgi:hypothetical protein